MGLGVAAVVAKGRDQGVGYVCVVRDIRELAGVTGALQVAALGYESGVVATEQFAVKNGIVDPRQTTTGSCVEDFPEFPVTVQLSTVRSPTFQRPPMIPLPMFPLIVEFTICMVSWL